MRRLAGKHVLWPCRCGRGARGVGFLTDIMASAFRANRQLGSGDRRLISETVYGLVRWERRLEAVSTSCSRWRRDAAA